MPPVLRVRTPAYHHAGPIYMHDREAADRINKPDAVIFITKKILLCWTDGGQP